MLAFVEWVLNQKKKKERRDERHNSQVGREIGNLYQQGEVARDDSQITQQTIYVFAEPKL